MQAEELIAYLGSGRPVDLAGVTVQGDVDLQPVGVVRGPFRCQRCRFTGSLNAPDVVFEGPVEADGVSVDGTVDLTGSTLKAATRFTGARFLDDVSFTNATLMGEAMFERAQMRGRAFFSEATFSGDARFAGAAFEGKADFNGARFVAAANFQESVFAAPVNFQQATFAGQAGFVQADFQSGGNFRLITSHDRFSFAGATSAGSLEFNAARFQGATHFSRLTSSGSVSLDGVYLDPGARLFMNRLSVADLSMEPFRVGNVRGPIAQTGVLQSIERSAKARGDLSLANDARFRLLQLAADTKRQDGDQFGYFLDAFLYRDVAGYLVHPFRPLVSFLVLIAVAAVIRSISRIAALLRRRSPGRRKGPHRVTSTPAERLRQAVLTTQKSVTAVLNGVAEALTVAFRPKPHIEVEDQERVSAYFVAALRWLEFLAYKLLFVTFLIALGNSNATIRELLDAVGIRN